jgi:ligand-binding SRPBCC domain-containing protein
MARIEESIKIMRPPENVFAFTTDAKSWPKWQSILPEAEQTSPGPVGERATFKGKAHMMGLTMSWTAKATEYEPDKHFGKNITSMGMFIEQHNSYKPVEGGTQFAILYIIKVRGFFKLFSPMLVSTLHKELKKSLANLKSVLEAQT